MRTGEEPLLAVEGLCTSIRTSRSEVRAVDGVDLTLRRGETLGLVGESGSGKSMTGLSVMGLLPPGGRVTGGSIRLEGRELADLPERRYQRIRGNEIAMVFQDPMTSLNPTRTIGEQIAEPVRLHRGASRKEARDRALEMLAMVGIAGPAERLGQYPHELSGGLRQRVMIAMALSCEPKVLIADEPTTALDVTVQAQVLRLLHDLKERLGMAMLLITHDMGVVAQWVDRVGVMYAGGVIESAGTAELFTGMRHPYAQGLLACTPRLTQRREDVLFSIPGSPPDLAAPPAGCRFADRCGRADDRCRTEAPALTEPRPGHTVACWHPVDGPLPAAAPGPAKVAAPAADAAPATTGPEAPAAGAADPVMVVEDLVKEYPAGRPLRGPARSVKAVSGVSFEVPRGRTFGLVGESGSGKSTLARMLVALEKPSSGGVTALGGDLARLRGRELRRHRRDLQMMFQDSLDALDPRMRVGAALAEPFAAQGVGTAGERLAAIHGLLDEVGLPHDVLDRHPHEFSGGQRQRIALARALALNPRVIVADEPVSALDVSIRSQVLNLMRRLQAKHDLTFVVISHDLTVVRYLADTVGVMYLGKLVEIGSPDDVYLRAAHPYTAGLIAAIPVPEPGAGAAGDAGAEAGDQAGGAIEMPSPFDPPSGCRFRTRCPRAEARCAEEEPVLRDFGPGHVAACHFPLREPEPAPEPAARAV
ncbi:dipeptide ABC transporter ATP-binding protein [Actinomadura opuntiae]|uniref:dipeptide ABC transporter ATP-binding protein n=1 Tax=Actinomadura sp. OS1-43 TaxID=604315 RepID=UPI00255A9E76|nr:ABC transporter ATP-binding protein [Actinomadura sp. OS1-43]MDL4817441.1 ABC transporter ATP-binding protein [Actinomadura sp. OS1-43]